MVQKRPADARWMRRAGRRLNGPHTENSYLQQGRPENSLYLSGGELEGQCSLHRAARDARHAWSEGAGTENHKRPV